MQELYPRELENKVGQMVLYQEYSGPKLKIKIISVKRMIFSPDGLQVEYHYLDDPEFIINQQINNVNIVSNKRHFYEPLIEDDPISDDPIQVY